MTATGWTNEPPEVPAMPMAALLLDRRERQASPLETALARSRAADARQAREEAAGAYDADEHASNLLSRGYMPGELARLSQLLGDAQAELQAEQEKLDRSARRSERLSRELAAGRVSALDIARMQGEDEGDPGRVALLERRVGALQRQVADMAGRTVTAPGHAGDPLEAASRGAHELFVAVTRAKMAEARQGTPATRPGPRPFGSPASISRGGGVAVRSEECIYCAGQGIDAETSFLLHSDPELRVPVTTAMGMGRESYPDGQRGDG